MDMTQSTGEVARELGTTEPRLRALIRFGKLVSPRLVNGKCRWRKADKERARAALTQNGDVAA